MVQGLLLSLHKASKCHGGKVIEIQAPKPPKGAVKDSQHIYIMYQECWCAHFLFKEQKGQVAVPAGIYIVRIGNAIEKVVVR